MHQDTRDEPTPHRKRAHGRLAVASVIALCAGCGTLNSYASGCPAPFSGVRTDYEYLTELGRFTDDGFDYVMISGDLPLSSVLDLATLPIGFAIAHPPEAPVARGCAWASETAAGARSPDQ